MFQKIIVVKDGIVKDKKVLSDVDDDDMEYFYSTYDEQIFSLMDNTILFDILGLQKWDVKHLVYPYEENESKFIYNYRMYIIYKSLVDYFIRDCNCELF